MKILLINGSPKKSGNTYIALYEIQKTLEAEGIETELIHVGHKNLRGCIACSRCKELGKCIFDVLNKYFTISNNHDIHDRKILVCKPVVLKHNCWIGAGASILPGVTIGENAIVGAGSVVTKDVETNTVVAGNPAKVIKHIS